MGTAESRRRRKEQKERLQRKRADRLAERQVAQVSTALTSLTAQVSSLVADGSAKVAVGMLPGHEALIVAMWDDSEPVVRTRRLTGGDDGIAESLMRRGIYPDEWLSFLTGFLQTGASAEPGQAAISMMQWRPGEGPPVGGGSTVTTPTGLPGGTVAGH
jgi:hypothetical protein